MILVLQPQTRPIVDRIFSSHVDDTSVQLPDQLEFPLRASTTVRELEEVYGIAMDADGDLTLDAAILSRLEENAQLENQVVRFGQIALHVRKLSAGGTIEQISMLICSDESQAGDSHCSEQSDEKAAS